MWAAITGLGGWSVVHIDAGGEWDVSFAPDQFGRVRSVGYRRGGPHRVAAEATAAVLARLSPRQRRFGDRWSSTRERLCVEIAQHLNAGRQ